MKLSDMLFANAMMGEGGGGGGGDFSTAEVILTINGEGVDIAGANIYEYPEYPSDTGSYGYLDPPLVTVILYKGKAFLAPLSLTGREVSTTGDVTYDSVTNYFIVTGNGTITIS